MTRMLLTIAAAYLIAAPGALAQTQSPPDQTHANVHRRAEDRVDPSTGLFDDSVVAFEYPTTASQSILMNVAQENRSRARLLPTYGYRIRAVSCPGLPKRS